MDEDVNQLPVENTPEPQTQRFSDSAMHGLLRAGFSGRTRALRHWEPPGVADIQRALPQYEVSAFIARGGMGAVYKGVQKALGRAVAIKILPPDILDDEEANFSERFKREARAMASLTHPNIVAVHEAGETAEGLLYFVMEFVEGTDLAQLVASEGRIDTLRALDITRQVCEALAFAHESGIVHRDIKPSNIMLDRKGRVKVADFGLARMAPAEGAGEMTGSAMAMGTPDYMAPEALTYLMPVDQRADLYAVGVMLYQMLTGDVPRGRFPMPSAVVPGIDRRLDAIVDKAMQTDREQRYSSAVELREALVDLSAPAMARTGAKRHRLMAVATMVLVIGFGVWWMLQPPPPNRDVVGDSTLHSFTGPFWSKLPTKTDRKRSFTNTLGMKFVPVPGTEVLFCIHETRKGDYAAYAAATPGVNESWQNPPNYRGEPVSMADDHPVVMVNLTDAQAFCSWLSQKEGRRYRLPTDHEWSCAVGLGESEDAKALPVNKSGRNANVFAWGMTWPPPKGAGNMGDATLKRQTGQEPVIPDYDDGFATTAPVMSFTANALGLYDLAGNVWERCPDWFDAKRAETLGRGSSFDNGGTKGMEAYVNACVRNPGRPERRSSNYGFRIVAESP